MATVIGARRALIDASRPSSRAAFAFTARALQQVAALVMTLLAARFLAPQDYGVYSLGIVFIILIQTLTYTGFYQFILTSREDETLVLATCFWLIVALVSAASLVLAAMAWPLEWLFDASELGLVLLLLAALQPLASVGAWSSAVLLRRGQAMRNFQIMFAQNLLALVGGTALLLHWHSLYALVAFRAIRVLSGAILYTLFARTYPRLVFDLTLARQASRFSAGLYGSRLLGFLSQYAADLLLGIFHNPAQVGLYRFGNRLASGVTDAAMQPITDFASMQLGAAARKGQDLARTLAEFAGASGLFSGILAALIIAFAKDAIELFFQPSYAAALTVTYAMALRALAGSGKLLLEPTFAALGRTGWVMLFNFMTSLVSIGAIFAVSPWGLEALAWTQVCVVLASSAYGFALLRRRGGIPVSASLRNFGLAILLSVNFGLVLTFARSALFATLEARLTVPPSFSLLAQMSMAALLALAFLILAVRLRVLNLRIFCG